MNAKRYFLKTRNLRLTLAALLFAGGFAVQSETTNAPMRPANFSAFQIVSDRNIFNPNRYAKAGPRTYTPRTTRRTTTSFSLAGIMSYGEGESPGTYAFFDGTSADFRQVLQVDGTIANCKVTAITFDSVTLQSDTNQFVLKVGNQMRQENPGRWTLVTQNTSMSRSSYDETSRGGSDRRRGYSGAVSSRSPVESYGTNNLDNATAQDAMPDAGDVPPEDAGAQPDEAGAAETLSLPAGPPGTHYNA